jgi:hypothetical protein
MTSPFSQPSLNSLGVRANIIGGAKFTADVVDRNLLEITGFDGNGAVHFNRCRSATVTGYLHSPRLRGCDQDPIAKAAAHLK